jgi:hypothetical protein
MITSVSTALAWIFRKGQKNCCSVGSFQLQFFMWFQFLKNTFWMRAGVCFKFLYKRKKNSRANFLTSSTPAESHQLHWKHFQKPVCEGQFFPAWPGSQWEEGTNEYWSMTKIFEPSNVFASLRYRRKHHCRSFRFASLRFASLR